MALILRIFLVLLGFASVARADLRPAEPPPDDFAAGQYIDSRGCVFRRDGAVWVAAMLDDAQICGYPPSFGATSAGAIAPRAEPAARSLDEIERDLLMAVASDGVLSAATAPLAGVSEVVPFPAERGSASVEAATPARQAVEDVAGDLSRALAAAPAIRSATRGDRNSRLCAMMGLGPARGTAGDLAGGECGAPLMRAPAATTAATTAAAVSAASRDQTALSAQPPAPQAAAPQAATPQTRAVAPSRAAPARAPRDQGEMIPDGARYVQLGAFAEPEKLSRAVSDLAGLGYRALTSPAAQDAPRVVMAGPFDNRERLISALHHIRASGYPTARAR